MSDDKDDEVKIEKEEEEEEDEDDEEQEPAKRALWTSLGLPKRGALKTWKCFGKEKSYTKKTQRYISPKKIPFH